MKHIIDLFQNDIWYFSTMMDFISKGKSYNQFVEELCSMDYPPKLDVVKYNLLRILYKNGSIKFYLDEKDTNCIKISRPCNIYTQIDPDGQGPYVLQVFKAQ